MMIYAQVSIMVTCNVAPLQMDIVCNGEEFSYRARHNRWEIRNDSGSLVGGKCSGDQEFSFTFAMFQIGKHIIKPASILKEQEAYS